MNRPSVTAWSVRRALRRHRRPLAALCAAAAVWSALRALGPQAPATVPVPVAARDLAGGTTLTASDVTTVDVPPAAVPDGAAAPPAGAVLAAPLRRGEVFTDVRIRRPGGVRPSPGSVVVSVRTADPAAVLVVRPGDRIDVLAGPGPGGAADGERASPETLASSVLVLAVPGRPAPAGAASDDGSGSGGSGDRADGTSGEAGLFGGGGGGGAGQVPVDTAGVLVVATDRSTAGRLAAATGRALTVAVVATEGWGSPQSPRGEDQGP